MLAELQRNRIQKENQKRRPNSIFHCGHRLPEIFCCSCGRNKVSRRCFQHLKLRTSADAQEPAAPSKEALPSALVVSWSSNEALPMRSEAAGVSSAALGTIPDPWARSRATRPLNPLCRQQHVGEAAAKRSQSGRRATVIPLIADVEHNRVM